jgi:outer membrane protein
MKRKIYALLVCTLPTLGISAQTDSTSVTLDQCISAALNYNPSIKEAENETEISRLAIKTSRSASYPVLSTEMSGGFSNEYQVNNNYRTADASITADQVLWQHGKTNATIKRAQYNQQAVNLSWETKRQEIIVAVKTSYFNGLLQSQLNDIAADNIRKAGLFLEYAQERYKIGIGRKSDVLKAESDLAEAEFERNTYLNALDRTRNELILLTGIRTMMFQKPDVTLLPIRDSTQDESIDTLRSKAFRNYPELQIANTLQISQQSKVRETMANLYPRLGMAAGYNWSYNPSDQQQKGWYSVLTLRWLLFNGNEQRNQIQVENIRRNVYENKTEEVRTFLLSEINNRQINVNEAREQIRLSDRLMKTTSENLEIAQAQYKAGTGSMLELTDSRITYLRARQKNIQAVIAYQIALVNLDRLTGNLNVTIQTK